MLVSILRIMRAGFPAATWKGGTSLYVPTCMISNPGNIKAEQDEESVLYLCNDTPSADGTTSPNRHSRKDSNVSSQPAIFADMDLLP